MIMTAGAACIGAAGCLLASPYLARLTASVPDRAVVDWWRGRPVDRQTVGLTAAVAVAFGALAGAAARWSAVLPALVIVALAGAPLTVIDARLHRLPDRLVATAATGGGALLGLAALCRNSWHPLLRALEGASVVFAVLTALVLASPRSFGFGDAKLGAVLGAHLGWFGWSAVYYGIFAGFVLGAVLAVVLLAGRRATLKTAIPFGPALLLGALAVLAFRIPPGV